MSDFAFLDRPEPKRDWREHHRDIVRETLAHKLKHLANDSEQVIDYCKSLMSYGGDASEEIAEMETLANGLLLVALLLKRQSEGVQCASQN